MILEQRFILIKLNETKINCLSLINKPVQVYACLQSLSAKHRVHTMQIYSVLLIVYLLLLLSLHLLYLDPPSVAVQRTTNSRISSTATGCLLMVRIVCFNKLSRKIITRGSHNYQHEKQHENCNVG